MNVLDSTAMLPRKNVFVHSLSEVSFIWDQNIPAGAVFQDLNGIWHVGRGTDLESILFKVNLTPYDRSMLKDLKIGTE
jgi:hypothetical protein